MRTAHISGIHAKLLNYVIDKSSVRMTAMVHDDTKVIVKITVNGVPDLLRNPTTSVNGTFFNATGAIVCIGEL